MKPLIAWLQHVPFEGLGLLEPELLRRGELQQIALWRGDQLPSSESLAMLVVLGGPMGVGDRDALPWMSAELKLIEKCLERGIPVLGICLGAQMMAHVLGAPVGPSPYREIGWWRVNFSAAARAVPGWEELPAEATLFHWHGEMFNLPAGAVRLASSAGCPEQGFLFGGHALGLQFHPEATVVAQEALLVACPDDLVLPSMPLGAPSQGRLHGVHSQDQGRFIQEPSQIRGIGAKQAGNPMLLRQLLTPLLARLSRG